MTTLTLPLPLRRCGSQVAGALAAGLGHVIGRARKRAPLMPGLAGAALACYSVAGYDWRAGGILGGVFLLAMDRQIKLGPRGGE